MFRLAFLLILVLPVPASAAPPDLILHNGKIATVDGKFTISEAMSIRAGRIQRLGKNTQVLSDRGPNTKLVDLKGQLVLPGLIDSHTHPSGASMHEFDHPIPKMETIGDVLKYIKARTKQVKPGQGIRVRQVFITRLKEQRYPTRAELDSVAPHHPVVFSTGPDASLNSMALKLSGITRDFRVVGPGRIEKDANGEPTGILRSCSRYIKVKTSGRSSSESERRQRLIQLFRDYNSVGLTCVSDRNASSSSIRRYQALRAAGRLPVRMAISHGVSASSRRKISDIQKQIRAISKHPLRAKDPYLRIIGIKTFLDGGMLTGSAYLRKPWGISKIYSIRDPKYRGVLNIPRERLLAIVRTTIESGLQFTAHSVGDGAVHLLLDVYEEINRKTPIRQTRPCITHCNFMSREAVNKMAKLGVVADIQPAWLYLDTRTLMKQFGSQRLRYFQPLQSLFKAGAIIGGGSDHMQKIGSLRSVNPYNPFLGMWISITRRANRFTGRLHPQEALTRQQAIRFYTRNNAHLLFLEKEIGSLEPGKQADFVVLDRDILKCPVDAIRGTQVLQTYIQGRQVYKK